MCTADHGRAAKLDSSGNTSTDTAVQIHGLKLVSGLQVTYTFQMVCPRSVTLICFHDTGEYGYYKCGHPVVILMHLAPICMDIAWAVYIAWVHCLDCVPYKHRGLAYKVYVLCVQKVITLD